MQLADEKTLDLAHVRHFVVDECDKCLESVDMRADVQAIFRKTPHDKQVMMFSATLSADVRPVCKKFMRDVSSPPWHLWHCHHWRWQQYGAPASRWSVPAVLEEGKPAAAVKAAAGRRARRAPG